MAGRYAESAAAGTAAGSLGGEHALRVQIPAQPMQPPRVANLILIWNA